MVQKSSKKIVRHTNTTVLLVGEGKSERVFLEYLIGLYVTRDCGVSARAISANGKGPEHIVSYAIRQLNNRSYDRVAILLDTDLDWSNRTIKDAKRRKIQLIPSEPCLEGFLLSILDRPIPHLSHECKRIVRDTLRIDTCCRDDYKQHFGREVLDSKRGMNTSLNAIINVITK